MEDILSLTVDLSEEKEDEYKRIFLKSPLLNSSAANWDGISLNYDYLFPGEIPEVFPKQHGLAIFTEVSSPIQAERMLDGCWRQEQVVGGDIVVSPANVGHAGRWDTAGGTVLIGLEPIVFTRVIDELIDINNIELIPHFAKSDPLIYQIGLALKTVLENPGAANRLYAETMTNALIVHLLQYYCTQKPIVPNYSGGLPKHKLQRVIDYINSHLEQDLSLGELAGLVQMSSHYFCQLFKQSTGITPHQYVIRCRVERAKELLLKGKLTVSEIAATVGFADQSHLHRYIKRLLGVTPRILQQKSN